MRIGELQGSIEQGAIKQLRDINEDGEYAIETSEEFERCMVSLKVVGPHQVYSTWTLDELSELESKLVLITRTTSPWLAEKDLFQEVCMLLFVLLSLSCRWCKGSS